MPDEEVGWPRHHVPLKPERRPAAKGLKNRYAANASIHELAEEIGRSYGFVHRTLAVASGAFWSRGVRAKPLIACPVVPNDVRRSTTGWSRRPDDPAKTPKDRELRVFIDIPSELEAALIDLPLPPWRTDDSFLATSTMERYRTDLTAIPQFEETTATLRHALTREGGGYAVLRLGNLAKELGTDNDRFLRIATSFAAEVAVPFSPFPRWPLWKDIGVKVEKDPGKSSGIGYNAFHMDLVNATLPPDFTTLLCVRPDPLGGGPSILSDAHAAAARLSEDCQALLTESAYHYGTFFDLFGVGEEYKPFPILDGSNLGKGFVRFSAKMLERSKLCPEHAEAARELADELVRGQVSFMLQPGDYLVVNQRRFLHGREALHSGQETVPVADRRLLIQLFLRAKADDGPAM
ncbi:hypothetical protein GCM10009566_43030 [Streptomyces murinus]|uniref:TauD/TfdA-like domain-containing protein n=1 Tax=Streptomyces murinus TaxID=33900 RepID=A0A7W3RIE4_STRMR|nr:hypothetical protein [Streptomyces murinus]